MVDRISFTLDGQATTVQGDPKQSVLSVLHSLGVSTPRSGCAPQGVCGSCVVLIDEKPRLTCTLPVKAIAGKSVVTQQAIEEAPRVAQALAATGAVQCGFCIPGIVTQITALLKKNPDPSPADIDKALSMHMCRCTGWQSIREAVELLVNGDELDSSPSSLALGQQPTLATMHRPGLVHVAVVLAPGRGHLQPFSVPEGAVYIKKPGDLVYPHDVVALVVGETPTQATKRASEVVVAVDPVEAAPPVRHHERREVGQEVACAWEVEELLELAQVDPAFLEPEATLVVPLATGAFRIYTPCEDLYAVRRLHPQLEVVSVPSGGGFGGRRVPLLEGHALQLAKHLNRPVRLLADMVTSTRFHPKRAEMTVRMRLGCDASGRFQMVDARIDAQVGAAGTQLRTMLDHLDGPYAIPCVRGEAVAHLSEGRQTGGLWEEGVDAVATALERCVNKLASAMSMDALELRMKNLADPVGRAVLSSVAPAHQAHAEPRLAMAKLVLGGLSRVVLEVTDTGQLVLHTAVADTQGQHRRLAHWLGQALAMDPGMIMVRCTTRAVGPWGVRQAAGQAVSVLQRSLQYTGSLKGLAGQSFVGEAQGPHPVWVAQVAEPDESGRIHQVTVGLSTSMVDRDLKVATQGAVVRGLGALTADPASLRFRELGLLKPKEAPNVEVLLVADTDSMFDGSFAGAALSGAFD